MSRSDSSQSDNRQKLLNLTMAGVAASVGCLTLVIILAAVFVGMWLDARNGTRPWFTLGLVVLSIPISLAAMFLIVRLAISRIKAFPQKTKIQPTEETGIGKDS